jgi:hypothetical protein
MSSSPEDFEALRKLMKLKRYEQPPPRFFEDFSSRVQDGILAAKPASFGVEAPWLARFFRFLEANSLVAGGFATAVCALMLGGLFYSESLDQMTAAVAPVSASLDGRIADNSTPFADASFNADQSAPQVFSTDAVLPTDKSDNPFAPSSQPGVIHVSDTLLSQ